MAVVKARLFQSLSVPLDGNRTFGGKPIFGPNKTWRGVVVNIVCAALIGAVQGAWGGAWAARGGLGVIDFEAIGARLGLSGTAALALGYGWVNAVFGLGYVLGELPNSFAKRRVGIEPGKTGARLIGAFFFLLDQGDSVIAGLGLGLLVFHYGWPIFVVGAACGTALHLFINASLYFTKVRRNL
jgi:CDP-diglyceride synthetase